MKKFYQKLVIDLIKNFSVIEDIGQDLIEFKRDVLLMFLVVLIFYMVIINIFVKVYMSNVMFQLFGRGGILENGGFFCMGFIYCINVLVFIVFFGNFGNRLLFLNEVLVVYYFLINDSCFVLVVQLFFIFEDF